MKSIYLLLATILLSLFSCKKDKDPIPENPKETKVLIEGESFFPTESSAKKTGNGVIFTFKWEGKSITIKTNDIIIGTYNIISQSVKSGSPLMANLTYKDGNKTYDGTSGTFTITNNEGELISGIYNSKAVSDDGIFVNIDSGSFIDVKTGIVIPTESDINDSLLLCYSKLKEYIEFTYLFDAVYSNTIPAPNSTWTEIYQHSQTQASENEKILSLWSDAYEIIYKTNLIIESAGIIISDELVSSKIIGQAKAIRAYLFYNLMTWFGEIPVETSTSDSLIPRNTLAEVLAQIKEDATEASYSLPISWPISEKFRIPLMGAKALFVRASMYSKNYSEALGTTQDIVNSAMYALSADTNDFTSANTEIFWGFEKGINTEFNDFFNKGSYIPVIRYTESYLISAEALFYLGNAEGALNYFNALNVRRGKPMITSLSTSELFQEWNTELVREGSVFTTLKRFERALGIVQNYPHKLLLPVPLSFIINNVYLTQNIGY
jgi:hypothetical protein